MTYPLIVDDFYFIDDGNRLPLLQRLAKFSVSRDELMTELERNCNHDVIVIPDDIVEIPKKEKTPPPQGVPIPEDKIPATPPGTPPALFPLAKFMNRPPLPELVVDDLTQINERDPAAFEESQGDLFPQAQDILDLLNTKHSDYPLTQVNPLTPKINLDLVLGGHPLPKGNKKRMADQINEEDEVTLPTPAPAPKRRTPTPSPDLYDSEDASYSPPSEVKAEKSKANPRYFSSIVLKPKRVYRAAPKAPLAMGKTGAFEGSITLMAPARRLTKGYKPLLPEAKILDSVADSWGPASTSKGTSDAEKSSIYYAYSPAGRAGFSKGKWVNPTITVKREEGSSDVTVKVDCQITINQLLPVDDIMVLIGQIFSAKTVQKVSSVPEEENISEDEFDEVDEIV